MKDAWRLMTSARGKYLAYLVEAVNERDATNLTDKDYYVALLELLTANRGRGQGVILNADGPSAPLDQTGQMGTYHPTTP
jgi:hypothetical protein